MKRTAYDFHLPIYQPKSLKTDEARELFDALSPELIVVVAYGKILPQWLLQMPRYGCINLHGSLLPKYRGAAPVHWAIANGEQETGACTMQLEEGLDTGPVYLCESTAIGSDETSTELYGRLSHLGAPLVLKTIERIIDGTLKPAPQDESQASFAPILRKEDGWVEWRRAAREIHNRIRAFNPWPGTVAKFRDSTCKILQSRLDLNAPALPLPAGSVLLEKHRLAVICGDGLPLDIVKIQPENRKATTGREFANGARIRPDEKFEALMDN